MSGDNMQFKLDFDIGTKGEEKLDRVDKTIARMTANVERLVAASKAVSGLNSILAGASTKGGAGSTAATKHATRALRDQLGIDRDRLRVAKMSMTYRQNEATQAIKAAQIQERQARQAFRDKLTFASRLAAQRLREDNAALRAVRTEQRAVERSFRQKMSFATRIANQRSREEAAAEREIQRGIRETGRLRQAEQRRALADHRAMQRERSRGMSQIGRGAGRARDGSRTAIGVGAAAGAVTAYTGQRVARAVTNDATDLDAAMNRNARMQPELGGSRFTGPLMLELRKKFMPIAAQIGRTTAEMFNTRAELLQAGLSNELADRAAEEVSKFASINEMDPAKVASDFGYGIQVLGLKSNQDVSKLLNIAQYMAANSPASREQLSSFMKRGLGNGRALNMSLEDTVAYGAAATSAGSDGESAARMLGSDSMNIAANAAREDAVRRKHTKNEQDRAFLSAPSKLGFRDWQHLKQSMDLGSADTLSQIYDRIGGAGSPMEKMQLVEQVFGKNFGSVHLGMAESGGFRKMRGIASDPKAARALEDGLEELRTTLGFAILRITNTVRELSASLGMVLKPLWQQAADWTTKLSAGFDNFKEAFSYGVKGLLYGLGSTDGSLTDLLNRTFGDPTQMRANVDAVFRFAHGFGEGIRSVVNTIKSVFGGLSVLLGASSPAEIGKLVAQFMGFATVLTIMAPAALVIGAFSKGLLGLIEIIVGGARLVAGVGAGATIAGAAGGGGAAAAAGGAAAAAAQAGKWSGGLGALGLAGLAYSAKELSGLMAGAVDNATGTDPKAALSASGAQRFGFKSGGILGYGADYLTGGTGGVWGALSQLWGGDNGRNLAGAKIAQHLEDTKKAEQAATEQTNKLLTEANAKTQELIDLSKKKEIDDKSKQIRDEEKRKLDSMLTGIRNPAMSGSVGGGSSAADDLRARGFNVTTPNTTPNGANGNMPQANGGGGSGDDASPDQKSGGSRSWRNNNPGNIEYGPFARKMGAIGSDGRFAKFPSYQAGRKAQETLLFDSSSYKNLTLGQAIRRWAPASENNVPAYLRAMGGDSSMRMSEYSPEQRQRLLNAMQQHEGWRQGTIRGGGSSSNAGSALPGLGGQSVAVDNARRLLGVGSQQAAHALGRKMTPGNWCADFVNGALESANIKGVQGSIATSFRKWGVPVADGIKAGDVVVTHRGRAAGETGGHVGLATGNTRMKNGRLQYETISGNYSKKVGAGWEYQDRVEVRRAVEDAQALQRRAAEINKPTTAGRGPADQGPVSAPVRDQWGNSLGQTTPTRTGGSGLGQTTPTRNGPGGRNGDAGSGGGGVNVHGPIHISVPGAGDPKAVATAVNNEMRSRVMARMHDIDPTAV